MKYYRKYYRKYSTLKSINNPFLRVSYFPCFVSYVFSIDTLLNGLLDLSDFLEIIPQYILFALDVFAFVDHLNTKTAKPST